MSISNRETYALMNVANFGDTDVFPYLIENVIFYDKRNEVKEVIKGINGDVKNKLVSNAFNNNSAAIPSGILGYRWATQIDPIWNVVLLSQVIGISDDIERHRIKTKFEKIHSYRFNEDSEGYSLFDKGFNWKSFVTASKKMADKEEYSHVLRIDISDFYTRIYHHRLENNLNRVTKNTNSVSSIMAILQVVSENTSYGLPVGGNAARILAEALLISSDEFLKGKAIEFTRFVDDYVVFCKNESEAHKTLGLFAEHLLKSEGLSLQKNKTQLITSHEYISQINNLLGIADSNDDEDLARTKFLNLNLFFDPYSPTASEDYKELKKKLNNFDILDLIRIELRKSKLHFATGRKLLQAIKVLDGEKIGLALNAIFDNIHLFYPLFPQLMISVSKCIEKATLKHQNEIFKRLCELVNEESYIVSNDNNLAYIARVLSKCNLDIAIQTLDKIYAKSFSPIVRVNCAYSMINLRVYYWLSTYKDSYGSFTRIEKTACLIATFVLGDEGFHWRKKLSPDDFEVIVVNWADEKFKQNKDWKLPL